MDILEGIARFAPRYDGFVLDLWGVVHDGQIVEGGDLRAELAGLLRRHRPDVVLSINYRDWWGNGSWNHADHRAVGRALLDAVRDAANPWLFPEQGEPWAGVKFVAFSGSPNATHAVDTTATFDVGVRALAAHRTFLEHLGGEFAEPYFSLRGAAEAAGRQLGVELATAFEVID